MPLHPHTRSWLQRELGDRVSVGGAMTGGVTSHVYAVDADFVVKQVGDPRWLRERPEVIRYEAAVLDWLSSTALPVPEVVAVDPDGAQAGFPSMILRRLDGRPAGDVAEPQVWMDALARLSASVASVSAAPWIRRFERYQDADTATPPSWARNSTAWIEAIAFVAAPPPVSEERFIHRDFHAWNVLWSGGVSGVVDWSQASVGPPQMDAAHCRANLAISHQPATADRYGELWAAATGLVHDPYWDLVTCVDFLPDWRPSPRGNDRLEAWLLHVLAEATT